MRPPILLQFLEVRMLPLLFSLMALLIFERGRSRLTVYAYLLCDGVEIIIFHPLQNLPFQLFTCLSEQDSDCGSL